MRTTSNGSNEKNSNQSSDKLLQIMEALAKERLPVRLQDLSARVHMSQSTVLRYLNALQRRINLPLCTDLENLRTERASEFQSGATEHYSPLYHRSGK